MLQLAIHDDLPDAYAFGITERLDVTPIKFRTWFVDPDAMAIMKTAKLIPFEVCVAGFYYGNACWKRYSSIVGMNAGYIQTQIE